MKNVRHRHNCDNMLRNAEKDNLSKGKSLFRETDSIYLDFASVVNSAMDICYYDKECDEILSPICRFV